MMLARQPAVANARRTSAVRVPAKAKRTTARQVRARAAAGDAEKGPMEAYMDVSNKVPPLATAAAVPVVALSLLCKGITGSGLPGPLFGTIEGLSFLLLPVGAGSLIPVVQDILAEGDFSADAVLRKLKGQGTTATENIEMLEKKSAGGALGAQIADFQAVRAAKAKETPEETAAREKINAECAELAKQIGKKTSEADLASAKTEEELKGQNVMETIANSITAENADEDLTKMSAEDLDKKNLST